MTPERAASRLDRSVLRYVLLYQSQLNMLALERALQSLRDADERLRLESGAVRSTNAYRIALTFQLAAEIQLADADVLNWIAQDQDGLRRQMATDAAYFASNLWESGQDEFDPDGPSDADAPRGLLAREGWRRDYLDYMQARRRLHEDTQTTLRLVDPPDARDDEDEERPPPDPAMLYLASVAEGVIAMLGPRHDLAQWRRAAQTRSPRALRRPPPEVFDALLVGERSLVAGDGRWRYARLGQRAAVPERERGKGAREGVGAIAANILAANKFVAEALGTLGADGEFSTELFAVLSDEVRLLPTSPSATAVGRAVGNVQQRIAETAGRQDPRQIDDEQLLREFGALLARSEALIVHALTTAAFLSEVNAGSTPALADEAIGERTLRALRLLASGLNFDDKSGDEILGALRRFEGGLPPQLPTLVTSSFTTEFKLQELSTHMRNARTAARSLRADTVVYAAWDEAHERLLRFGETGVVPDASTHELLSAWTRLGPGQRLKIDPRDMMLQDWSAAFFDAVTDAQVPRWLAGFALRRLGAQSLAPAQREALLRAVLATPELGSDDGLAVRRALGGQAREEAVPGRTLAIVRQPSTRLFDGEGWRDTVPGVLVLILTTAQCLALARDRPALLRALPQPVEAVFEAPIQPLTAHAIANRLTRLSRLQRLAYFRALDVVGRLAAGPPRTFRAEDVRGLRDLLPR